MQRSEPFPTPHSTAGAAKLSARNFAPRQRALLEGLLGFFSDEFSRNIEVMLTELETQLFRSAEHARSNEVQRALLETQKKIRAHRAALFPALRERIEAALAGMADPPVVVEEATVQRQFSELALVDTGAMDEAVALKEIATRAEIRNSLPLFLLGQRLGVVVGRPAFDAERLPIGPRALCKMLAEAIGVFELDPEQRGTVFTQFDRSVLQFFGPFLETLNNYLIQQKILPHLTYVAPRSKTPQRRREAPATRAPQEPEQPQAATEADAAVAPPAGPGLFPPLPEAPGATHAAPPPLTHGAVPAPTPARGLFPPLPTAPPRGGQAQGAAVQPPSQGGPGTLPWNLSGQGGGEEDAAADVALFDTLRRLLAGRRSLLQRLRPAGTGAGGPAATPHQVQEGLGRIQQRLNAERAKGVRMGAMPDVRRELNAQLAAFASNGQLPQLTGEQGDTVDLIDMLFDQIGHEVRPQSPGGQLLGQLQLPLLRLALQDSDFFTARSHPARQLLTAIAETSAYWSSEEEADRDLIEKMAGMVQRVCEDPKADDGLFRELVSDLSGHLATQQRRAEVAERRHVEAARGREKLEIARLKAEEAIEGLVAGKAVPKFLATLLEQVWADVLALALLRGGDDAPAFQKYLTIAERLISASLPGAERVVFKPVELAQLRGDIETALAQVGHTGEEASAFCTRLLSVIGEEPAAQAPGAAVVEQASRTELTLKLRNRARLGEDVKASGGATGIKKAEKGPPLTPEEQVWHDRLRRMPFGTWFDFTTNQQGDKARRRLSWYSTVTGHCLFVNHRGQRAGEYTLSWMARELNRGNVLLVDQEQGSIVDRAWKAIVSALRTFAGGEAQPTATPTPATS